MKISSQKKNSKRKSEKNRGEVIEYLEWRLSGGKSLNESFPDGYLEAVKNILRNLYKLNAQMNLNKFDACNDFDEFDATEDKFREKAKDMTKEELLETLCMQLRRDMCRRTMR